MPVFPIHQTYHVFMYLLGHGALVHAGAQERRDAAEILLDILRLVPVAADQVQAAQVPGAHAAVARGEQVPRRDQRGRHIDKSVFVMLDK